MKFVALLSLFISLIALSGAGCPYRVKLDSNANAFEAADFTTPISSGGACDSKSAVGYAYCRVASGTNSHTSLVTFHVPPVKCSPKDSAGNPRTGCITVRVFFPDASQAFSSVVPFDQTKLEISWEKLLHKPVFEKGDRGFWGITYNILYIGEDGFEHEAFLLGEMRLRVYDPAPNGKLYLPLNNVSEDPNFVWVWKNGSDTFKMTTAGRVTVVRASR